MKIPDLSPLDVAIQRALPRRALAPTSETLLGRAAAPELPPEAFEERPTGSIPNLSDHRRRELMILPRLMHRIVENDYRGGASNDRHPDALKVRRLLADAMVEPINGLPAPRATKILDQINRLQVEVMNGFFRPEMERAKVAAILWHAIRTLLDEGILTLVEGSAAADAFLTMMPMFEHVLDEDRQDRSAQKQARKFLIYMRERGYFRG